MTKYIPILAFLLGCSTAPQKFEKPEEFHLRRAEFIGYWIGEMPTKEGKFMRWLVERRPDGSFTLAHIIKNSPDDPVKFNPDKSTFELGTWGVSGNIYFTATRQFYENKKIANFDTTQPGLYDAYKIVFFDGKSLTYQSLETGETFTVKKIPKGEEIDL